MKGVGINDVFVLTAIFVQTEVDSTGLTALETQRKRLAGF